MTQLDNQDSKKKIPKIQVWQYIKPSPVSKKSAVSAAQVDFFVMLVERLERALMRYFQVRKCGQISADAFERIYGLDEYILFVEGSHACGFVCTDMASDFDFAFRNAKHEVVIPTLNFPQIRQYIHTLLRAEKWADGCESPILDALRSGALQAVSSRLKSDRTLYATS
ncbi:hypothetical protein FK216_11890 [Moraxellaceae bacterium AER2_44_116]|nr:hypothetical protein [Moraxellaceae bacterium]TQC96626.1 hypothetical protein FK216_11890 [Moraxellaceae bacterium AER2_44_116]